MANVSGAAGYQRLTKIGNYISDNANRAADRKAANMRQMRAINADKAKAEDAKMDEAFKDLEGSDEDFQRKVTGFNHRDDVMLDHANTSNEKYMHYGDLGREAAKRGDWAEVSRMKAKQNKLSSGFKNLVADEESLTKLFQEQYKLFQEGKIDDDDWIDFMAAVERKDYEIGLDENDNHVVHAMVEGEDGKMKKVSKNISGMVNGEERPYEVFDVNGKDGFVDNMLVGFGVRTWDEAGKNFITTDKTWDELNEQAFDEKMIALGSNDRAMYSLLKQASGNRIRKKEGFTADDYNMVDNFLYQQVRAGFDESKTMKTRTRGAGEIMADNAANRAVTRRGQDINDENAKAKLKLGYDKLAQDKFEFDNPKKEKGKKLTKEEEKQASSALAYEIAMKINNVEGETYGDRDDAINAIGDEYGLDTESNWDFQWGDNEFELNGTVYDQDDPHTVAKAIAKNMGYEYDAKYAQDKLTKKLMGDKDETKPKEEVKPTEEDPLGLGI